MLAKLLGNLITRASQLHGQHHPTVGVAAVVILAGVAEKQIVVHGVQWSYDITLPSAGTLTMTDGIKSFIINITSPGPGGFGFSWTGSEGATVTITLAALTGVIGKLNVQGTVEV